MTSIGHGSRFFASCAIVFGDGSPLHCVRLEAVCVRYATGSRLRVAKDVPVLRVNHPRSKTSCLECGKSLAPARQDRWKSFRVDPIFRTLK